MMMSINKKHMTLKHVACTSFSWNKAGDYRTPILCPIVDKNKMPAQENAPAVTSK